MYVDKYYQCNNTKSDVRFTLLYIVFKYGGRK